MQKMDSATATEMFLCLYHSVSENSLFKFEFHAEFLTFSQGYLKHWGSEMVMDDEEKLSWARIHHLFNYNFCGWNY